MDLADPLLAAAAAFFVWHCLARVRPPGIAHLVPRLPVSVQRFLSCPWCAGAWLALLSTLLVLLTDQTAASPADLLLTWFAAATVVGLTGSLLPDDGGTT